MKTVKSAILILFVIAIMTALGVRLRQARQVCEPERQVCLRLRRSLQVRVHLGQARPMRLRERDEAGRLGP